MAKHDCAVPPARNPAKAETWKCPVCKQKWGYKPRGNAFPDAFYSDLRDSNGAKK